MWPANSFATSLLSIMTTGGHSPTWDLDRSLRDRSRPLCTGLPAPGNSRERADGSNGVDPRKYCYVGRCTCVERVGSLSDDIVDVRIDGDHDEETVRAIVTALSEHLERELRVVEPDGGGLDRAEEGVVLTEREQRLRAETEDLLAGGPDRGFEKIEDLGKLFVCERMDGLRRDRLRGRHFRRLHGRGPYARRRADHGNRRDRRPRDIFHRNDYTVKAGSLGAQGIEKEIRLAERAVTARAPIVRLIDSTGARLTPGEREKSDSHADRYVAGSPFSTSVSTQDRSHRSGCSTGRTSPGRPVRRCSVTFSSWSIGSRGWPSLPPASSGR